MDIVTLALAKAFTKKTVDGLGALKGANAVITSITKENGISTITFEWTGISGAKETDSIQVADGEKGDTGLSVKSLSIDENEHLIVTYSDNTTEDAGAMPEIELKISAEGGNALIQKEDGLYVAEGAVKISPDENNALESRENGLYAENKDLSKYVQIYNEEGNPGWTQNEVDSELSKTSERPVQNKVITTELEKIKSTTANNDYEVLNNKPSIEGVELINNLTFEDLHIASAAGLAKTDETLQNLSDSVGDKNNLPMPTNTVVDNIALIDTKVDSIIDDNETGLAKTFSSDKITKTFATLEEVNERIPQYDVLPTPTEAFGGKVVQFIGTTTEDYIHNYFYECVQVEGNYKWVNTVVQNVPTKVSELTNDNSFVTETKLNEKGYLTEHQDISGKVDKEEGKSLIADSEITRLSTVKNYDDSAVKEDIATIKTDYATKTYVGEQIAAADHLKREIVTEAPTAEAAAENVIYMLKVESAIGADKYKEYMLIDGEVACVGDTSVDLTDYAKKSEIPTELPANGGNADTVNTHTVASDVPENAIFTDTVYDDTAVKEDVDTLKKETTVNLLNPTLKTTTSNGITCTNNGDGTYTLSGIKTTDTIWLKLGTVSLKANTSYKLIGQSPTYGTTDVRIYDNDGVYFGDGTYKGATPIITPTADTTLSMQIRVAETTALDNFIVKPMITTNLDAIYDDFVPYIGNTGKLNSDVAQALKACAKASLYGETTINVGQTSDSAIGNFAIAFGENVDASGSFSYAHGIFAKATKDHSHAEGHLATASNIYSYARGDQAKATGSYSHAEGVKTTASGECSYAEGYQTKASGQESHAEGMGTIAAGSYQHVEGQYNIEDTENKYAHIIGKGTRLKKRNIHTVDWSGNAEYAGDVTATDSSGNKTHLLETIHKVYSMEVGNSAVEPVVISDFKIDPTYRYLYIINGSGTTGYEVGILMFINGMKFVPLSSSDSATAMKDSVSAIGIDIYIEQGQLKVSRSATSYAATCVIYKLG